MADECIGSIATWLIGVAALTAPAIAACRPVPSDDVTSVASGRDSGGWHTYVNPRYRYSICYPAGVLRPLAKADNGDGRSFVADDRGRLSVFGRNNVDRSSLAKTVDEDAADLAGSRGSISYRVVRPGWAVFSGNDGKSMLFYSKTIQRGDQFVVFELIYPKASAARYKPVAERLSRCFATTD